MLIMLIFDALVVASQSHREHCERPWYME